MAFYKNTVTNLVWEIVGDFEKQISNNPIFVLVEEEVKEQLEETAEQEEKTVKSKTKK